MAEEKAPKKTTTKKTTSKKEKKVVETRAPKTFVIGDIHGAHKALVEVLEKSGFDNNIDTLISIGDVVDGYPDSKKVVSELLKIKNLIAIRGNHDLWFKDYIEYGNPMDIWVTQGGRSTLKSYGEGEIPEDHRKFFTEKQVDYYIDDKKRVFVHAGLYPYTTEGHDIEDLFLMNYGDKKYQSSDKYYRECHWTRELDQMAVLFNTTRKNFKEQFPESETVRRCVLFNDTFSEIFVGHTPKKEVFNFDKYWNVDTDAGWGGKLTMMDIDTKEQFQSKPTRELYPGLQVRG